MSKTTLSKITLWTTISLSLLTFAASPAMASGFDPSFPSIHAPQRVPATSVPVGDYYCPHGGVLSNKTCTLRETTHANLSKTYTCFSDDILSNTTCTGKSSTALHNFYYCTSGTLLGESCVTTNNYSFTSQSTYSCPSGYKLSGASCLSKDTYSATLKTLSSCSPASLTLNSTGQCVGATSTDALQTSTYYCPNGGTLYKSTCSSIVSSQPSFRSVSSCPSGYNLSFGSCVSTVTTPLMQTYSCPNGGSLSGSTCTLNYSPSPVYSCSPGRGTLFGATCTNPLEYRPPISYSATVAGYACPNGGSYTGLTGSCVNNYPGALSAGAGCPSGYILNAGTCSMTVAIAPYVTDTQSCPSGATLSNNTCLTSNSYTASTSPNVYLSCPQGGTLSGSLCVVNTIIPSVTNSTYSCLNGGTLSGMSCSTPPVNATVAKSYFTCNPGDAVTLFGCTHAVSAPALLSNTSDCASLNLLKISAPECLANPKTYLATPATVYSCGSGEVLSKDSCAYVIKYPAAKHKK